MYRAYSYFYFVSLLTLPSAEEVVHLNQRTSFLSVKFARLFLDRVSPLLRRHQLQMWKRPKLLSVTAHPRLLVVGPHIMKLMSNSSRIPTTASPMTEAITVRLVILQLETRTLLISLQDHRALIGIVMAWNPRNSTGNLVTAPDAQSSSP